MVVKSLLLKIEPHVANEADKPPHPISEDEVLLRRLFGELDADHSGTLSQEELKLALAKLGLPCSDDYVKQLLNQYDRDSSGDVDFEEFRSYVATREVDMWRAFKRLDKYDTGNLTVEAVLASLHESGLPASRPDAQRMIELLDLSQDDHVSYDEFCRYMLMLPAAHVMYNKVVYAWLDSADWIHFQEFRNCMLPIESTHDRVIAAGISGVVARTLVAPIERLRTNIMTTKNANVLAIARKLWQDGGVRGLFKGNLVTCIRSVPYFGIRMGSYQWVKQQLDSVWHGELARQPVAGRVDMSSVTAGAICGGGATLAVYPLEVIRNNMAVAGSESSIIGNVKQIYKASGWRGFYRGLGPTLVCDTVGVGLAFGLLEPMLELAKIYVGQQHLDPAQKAEIAVYNSLLVCALLFPLDVVARRLQVKAGLYQGPMDALRTIFRQEGPRAFYRGLAPAYMQLIPTSAVSWATFEYLRSAWGSDGIRMYASKEPAAAASSK